MRIRKAELFSLLAVLMAVMIGVTGCGGGQSDTEKRSTRTPPMSVSEITNEATAFGGLVIPDGVTVLDARTESALDTVYQLALRTDPEGLTQLLAASNFTTPLTQTYRVTATTIAGPPLETSPSLLETGDRIQGASGNFVSRSVTVDERDATTRYVHMQLFTT